MPKKIKCPNCGGSGSVTASNRIQATISALKIPSTATHVAKQLRISTQASYNRLERLADMGLIVRVKKTSGRGSYYSLRCAGVLP
jgi:predicted ArsR family transcriptional regulator